MNYFGFGQIFFGIAVLLLGGCASAAVHAVFKILFLFRAEFFSFFKRLIQNRSRLCGFCLRRPSETVRPSRIEKGVLDFFAVVLLFFSYLLISFFVFDGVFRLIFVFPAFFAFLLFSRYPMVWIEKKLSFLFAVLLSFMQMLISVPVFIFVRCIRVLKMPFLFIMSLLKGAYQRRVSARKKAVFLRNFGSEIKKIL